MQDHDGANVTVSGSKRMIRQTASLEQRRVIARGLPSIGFQSTEFDRLLRFDQYAILVKRHTQNIFRT